MGRLESNVEEICDQDKSDDLYSCLRSYLIFGRCIGLLPLNGLCHKNVNNINFSKKSLAVITSAIIIIFCAINVFISIIFLVQAKKQTPGDIAWSAHPLGYFLFGFYIYIYFLRKSRDFIRLFQLWKNSKLTFYTLDINLWRDTTFIAFILFTSCVVENIILHLRQFPLFKYADVITHRFNMSGEPSSLEVYYYRGYSFWANSVPYNPWLTILLFIGNKLVLYSWNYGDILLALFSRALYFKFNSLANEGMKIFSSYKELHDPQIWKTVVEDHNKLSALLEEIVEFFSPLVFISYAENIYSACLLLHQTLTPSGTNSIVAAVYAVWATIHITMRVLVLTIYAARVNESSRKILQVFKKCPPDCYFEVERLERSIQYGEPPGFHGLKCFYITKPLVLNFFYTVMTFEIVLLQAASWTTQC